MKPDDRFLSQQKDFWAHVRTLSQHLGYTEKQAPSKGQVKVPTLGECLTAFGDLELEAGHLVDGGRTTPFMELLLAYFDYRADALNSFVESHLMKADEARRLFRRLKREYKPACPLPMNKQKGDKRAEAFFTCIINMLIEKHSAGLPCNFDPQELTTITRHGVPVRTLARRVDGAFTTPVNPVAVWEIKEYYYTTSFGSRVAGGVYESLLDGMELEELRSQAEIDVKHLLMVDAYDTWWVKGKSYLCRIIDMLHMGYVDEVLFGREVVDRLPIVVAEWVALARLQTEPTPATA